MTECIGQQLGNYRIIHLLGKGGFAEVYLGEHVYLKSQAAIKVLPARLANEDLTNFLSEAQTLVHLIHPHIVRVLDFGLEGDIPFLVMDYAPNGTLRQRHPKGTKLPLTLVVDYVKQVADALQYAHNIKVIHRDVKPENMLIGRNNEILLSDFGIAIVAQSSRYSIAQEIAGTIAYMAPEQIQSHPRPASDQYALAIITYEWLSGQRPFSGSFTEVAVKHAVAPVPSLQELVPTMPPAVTQVLQTALEKDPTKRFGNIRAFATALEQASKDTPFFLAPAPSSPQQPSLPTIVPPSPQEEALPTALATPPHQALQPAELATPVVPPVHAPPPAALAHTTPVEPLHVTGNMPPPQHVAQPPKREKRIATGLIIIMLIALLAGSFLATFLVLSARNPSTVGIGTTATPAQLNTPSTAPSGITPTPTPAQLNTPSTAPSGITPTPTTAPSPTPTQDVYPNMTGYYQGSIDNTYANIYSTMTLSVNQQEGNISGQFTVAQPLKGNGPFTGSIDTQGNFQFLVTSSDTTAPILFQGTIQSDGSLKGQYCSVNASNQCDTAAGGYGVWNAAKS